MGNEVELKPKDNYGGSELCRSRRDHICTLLCDEKSDTHYEPFLEACPLCKTDKPELSRDEKLIALIFCRKCGLELSGGDVNSLIVTWNTRASTSSPLTAEQAKEKSWAIIHALPAGNPAGSRACITVEARLLAERIASELMTVATVSSDPHPEDRVRDFPILVAAAVIIRDGQVLLERRAPTGVAGLDLMWDLPGGKVENGETPKEAIVREIQEELGIEITAVRMLPKLEHSVWTYGDTTRYWIIAAFECVLSPGSEPECGNNLQWFALDDLPASEILAADFRILQSLIAAPSTPSLSAETAANLQLLLKQLADRESTPVDLNLRDSMQ